MNPSSTELMQAFVVSHGQARFDDGRFDGVLMGLCFAGLAIVGVGLLGMYHSSLEVHSDVRFGYLDRTSPATVSPVVAQAVTPPTSVRPGWGC